MIADEALFMFTQNPVIINQKVLYFIINMPNETIEGKHV